MKHSVGSITHSVRLVLFCAVFAAGALGVHAAIPAAERNALIAIYNATNGAGWSANTGWLGAPGSECTWFGVTCDVTQTSVNEIKLSNNNLIGTIPVEVGNFPNLRLLELGGDQLNGNIPSQLGNLVNLGALDVSNNQLTGSIPTQLGSMAALQTLALYANQLTGSIPTQLGSLANLRYLYLGDNQLTGPIPTQLGGLLNLRHLHAYNNLLNGTIPSGLGSLPLLQELRLDVNQLTGSIPTQLGMLATLTLLELAGNQLTGSIPTQLGSMTSLQTLDLGNNQLSGAIPIELGQLANLRSLVLQNNFLSGPMPAELGNLGSLQLLSFRYNSLSGSIPTQLGNLANLTDLYLEVNNLSGSIPTELGLLGNLRAIDIDTNNLGGAIPVSLGGLTNLIYLYAYTNQLTGSIPTQLGSLANLQVLALSGNNLTGSIPTQLGSLANLQDLYVGSNNLTGSIPTQLGSLPNIQRLDLSDNNLTGSIPTQLGAAVTLREIYLGSNQLTGSIPTQLGALANLQILNFDTNLLTGSIPTQLGSMTNLRQLYLTSNRFTGSLPKELGNLTNLTSLYVDQSLFTGTIPQEIGNLVFLDHLYKQSNQLRGAVPSSILNLTRMLAGELDIRWNALYSSDPAVRAYLTAHQTGGDWEGTQTVAPTNVTASNPTLTSVDISWTPILYTGDTGGYTVSYGTTAGGPYPNSAPLTADKTVSSVTVAGLSPSLRYYFIVTTTTLPHANNLGTVVSDPSAEVSLRTTSCFSLTPPALPDGVVGTPYGQTITATGGTAPYTFSVVAGALPLGLALSPAGVLSGTPTTAATSNFTVLALDSTGCGGSQSYTVEIHDLVDVIVGQGLGNPNGNEVKVYRGNGTATTVDFFAYSAGKWGVNVRSGDVDGGDDEILTGPGPGDVFGPQVRSFRRDGTSMPKVNFYAYGTLKYGVNVAGGSVDSDSFEEILSGAGPGAAFGPHVRGWNFDGAAVAVIAKINFFAYGTLKYGVNVGLGRIDADAYAEILTGPGPGLMFGPQVRGWNFDGSAVSAIAKINFNAFLPSQYGVNVDAGDAEPDGYDEIACAPGPGAGASFPSDFRGFDFDGSAIAATPGYQVTAFSTFYGGRLGQGDVDESGNDELLAGAGRDPAADSTVKPYKYTGAALNPLASTFVPFGTSKYGVNAAGGGLAY